MVTALIFWAAFSRWRQATRAIFFILVIEGALRKWILPQASDAIYFLKDLILLAAYLRYYIFSNKEARFPIVNTPLNILIFVTAGWCLFQGINPKLGPFPAGVIGLRSYLFYIPLIWMTPSLFNSEEDLYKFLRSHLLLAIPVGILGIIQFFSPATSPINQYAPGTAVRVATFGLAGSSTVRIAGTFSYINSYQGYLSACFALLLPLLFAKQPRLWKIVSLVEAFFIILNSLMTGSRTPVIAAVLLTTTYWLIRAIRQPDATVIWLGRLSPFIAISVTAALIGFRPVIEAFWIRATFNTDLGERIALAISNPFGLIQYTALDGYGAGATHPGTAALRNALNLPPGATIPVELESEIPRIALEIGPIGFILWYGLRIALIVGLWLVFLKLKRPLLRDLALSSCLLQIILITGQMVFHHTFSVYYWFMSSFIFLLPYLEKIETWREQQQYSSDSDFYIS
ncbi:MAG: hypothetical protein SW833_27295 [Cyanobacteriota bacterium]|nr:hypothetical protein [Cyanobacteriota bacterium]